MRHHALCLGTRVDRACGFDRRCKLRDDDKRPDLQGHWACFTARGLPGQPSFDQTKPWGTGQQTPLTPE
jgi:hypothetical protein